MTPVWLTGLQVAANAAQITAVAEQLHRRHADRVARQLEELLADVDGGEAARRMMDNPAIAEVVTVAVSEALRTLDEARTEMLLAAVRKAVDAESDVQVDEVLFHTRTLAALEVPHITVFRLIVEPRDGTGQMAGARASGRVGRAEIESRFPGAQRVVDQVLARLVAEGLIERSDPASTAAFAGGPFWSPTNAGWRFAKWLGLID